MAGKIVADTLEHSTAGSIATNYVVEGSAKAWMRYTTTTTTVTRDSFNVSSENDEGVGKTTFYFTNNMNNQYYSASAIANFNTSAAVPNRIGIGTASTGETDYTATSSVRFDSHTGNGTTSGAFVDNNTAGALVFGDLA